ncbi:ComEC/Rec2 family competence protein, partial [Campylobacter jejuni]|nr:ComEC/Rec2 family competence protein [Campylobacter jejuni]
NIWTFFAMVLTVLYFFPLISYQQILGIILICIFVIFYPLVLFLHLINYGDLLNFILDEFFKFKIYGTNIHIQFLIFISYIIS